MDELIFLVNPLAGDEAGQIAWPKIEAVLREAGVAYRVEVPASAEEMGLRAQAWSLYPVRALVVVGGDGSVHSVVNGLMQAAHAGRGYLPLGIIPVGTNNDFGRMLGLPLRKPIAATHRLLAGSPYAVDIGVLRPAMQPGGQERFFVNGLGVGLEARLAEEAEGVAGALGYFLALSRALSRVAPLTLSITVEGVTRTLPVSSLTVGNGACHLGRLWLTPDAALDDGRLDLCLVRALPAHRLWSLLLRAMRGKHLHQAAVSMEQVTRLLLRSERPCTIHVDGERLAWDTSEMEITLLPTRQPMLI